MSNEKQPPENTADIAKTKETKEFREKMTKVVKKFMAEADAEGLLKNSNYHKETEIGEIEGFIFVASTNHGTLNIGGGQVSTILNTLEELMLERLVKDALKDLLCEGIQKLVKSHLSEFMEAINNNKTPAT